MIAVHDFTLIADKTIDMGDRCKLAIFVSYIDSDCHEIQEKFLGTFEIVSSRGCNVLQEKGVNIENMRCSGVDGTNTTSGEISGIQ